LKNNLLDGKGKYMNDKGEIYIGQFNQGKNKEKKN